MAKKKAKSAKKKKKTARVKKKAASKPAKKQKKKVARKKTVAKKARPTKVTAKKKVSKKAVSKVTKKTKPAKKAAAAKGKKVAKKPVKAKPVAKAAKAPAKKAKPVAKARKPDTGKTSSGAKAAATAVPKVERPVPIKVQPKIIETPEPEPVVFGDELFSQDELEAFRRLLKSEQTKILIKARAAVQAGQIQFDKDDLYDEVDQASAMVEQNLTFRLLDRDRKLLNEIEHALSKIDTGEYGYCEGTGEPIPKRRLELRPWTRHSVKYKEKLERMKKSGRGVVDEEEL